MDFGAEIGDEAGFVFAEKEHAGEGAETEFFSFFSDKKAGFNIDKGNVARFEDEPESASDAWAIQQTVELHVVRVIPGLLKPKFGEPRKFLAARLAGVDGKSAGRGAIAMIATDWTEVAGAQEGDGFRTVLGCAGVMDDFESGEIEVITQGLWELDAAVAEFVGGELIILDRTFVDDVELDGVLINIGTMKTLNAELIRAGVPRPGVGPETDKVVFVVTHFP